MDVDSENNPDGSPELDDRVTLLVRVWLPDRPGALGAVASRIGALGGDVHEIEVIDRGAGRAIDELVVTVPSACPLDLLAREIDEIDGVDIEELEPVPAIPTDARMQAYGAAVDLAGAADRVELARVLAERARSEVRADHVAVVDTAQAEVIARSGEGPAESWLVAFCRGVSETAGVGGAPSGQAEDIGWAVVSDEGWTLVASRREVVLRDRERQVLQALADLTGHLLARLK